MLIANDYHVVCFPKMRRQTICFWLRHLTALFNVGDGGPVIFKYDLMGHK